MLKLILDPKHPSNSTVVQRNRINFLDNTIYNYPDDLGTNLRSFSQASKYSIKKTNKAFLFLNPSKLGALNRSVEHKQQIQTAKQQLTQQSQDPMKTYQSNNPGTIRCVNMSDVMDTFTQFYMPIQSTQNQEYDKQKINKQPYLPKVSLNCVKQKLSNLKRSRALTQQQNSDGFFSTSRNFYDVKTLMEKQRQRTTQNSFISDRASKQSIGEQSLIYKIKENGQQIKNIILSMNLQNYLSNDNSRTEKLETNTYKKTREFSFKTN